MDERQAGRTGTEDGGPGEAQVLAALLRAERHRVPRPGPAPLRALLAHLALPARSSAARQVRELLGEMERRGLVGRGREHSVPVWSLSPAGARVLGGQAAQALPESPRHRDWRHARAAAGQELPRFCARLAATLAEAERMLARTEGELGPAARPPAAAGRETDRGPAGPDPAPGSDAWLALGRRLAGDCRRVGSAWHCLREWSEPGEEAPDPDAPAAGQPDSAARRARLAGLRNVRLWREDA